MTSVKATPFTCTHTHRENDLYYAITTVHAHSHPHSCMYLFQRIFVQRASVDHFKNVVSRTVYVVYREGRFNLQHKNEKVTWMYMYMPPWIISNMSSFSQYMLYIEKQGSICSKKNEKVYMYMYMFIHYPQLF
jgi:hypothetical protein